MAEFHSNQIYCFNENEKSIYLKKAELEDQDFLFQVFVECRPDLQWIVGIGVEQQQMMLRQQFKIENHQLLQNYPNAEQSIIICNNIPVGRLSVHSSENYIRILEIGLIESYRRKGIGSELLNNIKKVALEKGKTIQLQVAWFNESAYNFYIKNGFCLKENLGFACEMNYKGK